MNNIYITTPIYYVNDIPHVGHAYTSIACDALSRFFRQKGQKVFYLNGTDEHGLKIQQVTKDKDIEPQDFVDQMSAHFQNLTNTLNLSNDDFIRTTSERHAISVSDFWSRLQNNNQIYLDKYSGWFSIRDEAFYAENEISDGKAP